MDFYDATELMRLVQAVENDPIVSSGAGESLASKVREFIEDEAEMGGWYTELMDAIGEAEHEEPTFKECGTFTDHGFGFHAQVGTRTDYIIGYPYENDGWAVLNGSYDLARQTGTRSKSTSRLMRRVRRYTTCNASSVGTSSRSMSSSARASASTSTRRACSPARPTAPCTRRRVWRRPDTSP